VIHVAETTTVHSVEGFLLTQEIAELLTAITGSPNHDLTAAAEFQHTVPGLSEHEVRAVYEPAGRLERTALPAAAAAILDRATARALPAINRVMPSITSWRPWVYIEYGPGQYITSHVDNIAPDPGQWPRQVAGISVVIDPAVHGGEFYVETTGHPSLWEDTVAADLAGYHEPVRIARDAADNSSDWFRDMTRTRWTVKPPTGTALLYGSQLTHGTLPVVTGTCRKFISWLLADQP
jgi:hypothetical protein